MLVLEIDEGDDEGWLDVEVDAELAAGTLDEVGFESRESGKEGLEYANGMERFGLLLDGDSPSEKEKSEVVPLSDSESEKFQLEVRELVVEWIGDGREYTSSTIGAGVTCLSHNGGKFLIKIV